MIHSWHSMTMILVYLPRSCINFLIKWLWGQKRLLSLMMSLTKFPTLCLWFNRMPLWLGAYCWILLCWSLMNIHLIKKVAVVMIKFTIKIFWILSLFRSRSECLVVSLWKNLTWKLILSCLEGIDIPFSIVRSRFCIGIHPRHIWW